VGFPEVGTLHSFANASWFCTKVLLLDEPTAGMDPCSRHIVWNLLKNRKANRVTVFSTHFMDEADIVAGEYPVE